MTNVGQCVVVCNKNHRVSVLSQLNDAKVPTQSLVLESAPRNTAPAVAVAALQCQAQDPDAVMVVLSADHTIEKVDEFRAAIGRAADLANQSLLVTFGIVAHEPHTGFGYIQRQSEPLSSDANAYGVKGFVEKPDVDTARQYVESGDYYWNSGMFVFKANAFLDELAQHRPDILKACQIAMSQASTTSTDSSSSVVVELGDAFAQVPSESIDYAVMEKTMQAAVIPVDIGWSDVGSWRGLWDVCDKNEAGNSLSGDVVVHEVNNAFVRGSGRLVAVAGLDDIAVVDTEDAVLVTSMSHAEGIKHVVKSLQNANRRELDRHLTTHDLWGQRQALFNANGCTVSRLTLQPGAATGARRLKNATTSLTMVRGAVRVTVADESHSLGNQQTLSVAAGDSLQLANADSADIAEVIEVVTGAIESSATLDFAE